MIDRLTTALEGRYHIERELGKGGMATVYLAADLKHDRNVALKVLKPELAAVVGGDRFLTEIKTTANLQHPHILPLFDSGEDAGMLWYAMPYIEGESLRDRLDRDKQLPVAEAVGIAAKVAGALQVAHAAGVIHRDIKPANILLANGEPLIADFGIALAVQEAGSGRLTETGLSLGTPFYMSPEQATADRPVAPATDIYALGCVLFEMLVGEPPYVGNTAQAVLGKILTDTPRRPTTVRPAIRPNVEAVVLRSLEKLPADRFGSAAEFLRALEDPGFRHGEDAERAAMAASSGGGGLWRGLALVASAAAVGLAAFLLTGGESTAPGAVRFTLDFPDGLGHFQNNGVSVAISPDGETVVFVGRRDNETSLWRRGMNQLEPQQIAGTSDARNPEFSPDGGSIAFWSNGALLRMSLSGPPALTLVPEGVASGGGGVSWGDDGYIYYVDSGSIRRVPEDGGVSEEVVSGEESSAAWMDALPGGRGLLFTRNFGPPSLDTIQVIDLESREVRTLVGGAMARWSPSGHLVWVDGDGTLLVAPFDPGALEMTGAQRPVAEDLQVNSGSAAHFAISESGSLVYSTGNSEGGGALSIVGRVGDPERIGGLSASADPDDPVVSSDGRFVAFDYRSTPEDIDIGVIDLRDGAFSRLTFGGRNYAPFWHPDGDRVGFTSSPEGGEVSLYSVPLDLGSEPDLLWSPGPASALTRLAGMWDRSGERIVVNRDRDDLVTVYPHPDSTATLLFEPGEYVGTSELSPDGNWIAYVAPSSDGFGLFVRPYPGPGGQRQVHAGDGESVGDFQWLPDGDGIVYGEVNEGAWWIARFRSASDPTVVSRGLFRAPMPTFGTEPNSFDLLPDGRLVGIDFDNLGATTAAPTVVLNWFSELGGG